MATKYNPCGVLANQKEELNSMETQRDSFEAKLKDSLVFLKFMLTAGSYEIISDLLNRTSRDIKANVEKSNENLYQNYVATFKLEKIVGFRWRSFLHDVTMKSRKIDTSDAFNNLIDLKQSNAHGSSPPSKDECDSKESDTTSSHAQCTKDSIVNLKGNIPSLLDVEFDESTRKHLKRKFEQRKFDERM